MFYAVIMAGGTGTRLWPISRKNKPKQSQAIIGRRTLLQATFSRLSRAVDKDHILITAGRKSYRDLKAQLPKLGSANFSLEPERRDTAAALGLAAVILERRDPEAVLSCVYSDHYILDEDEYRRVARVAEHLVVKNPEHTVILGMSPAYPETGYGYIERARLLEKQGNDEIYHVRRFVEKPDLKTAQSYIASGEYLWNSGMFFWKVKTLLSLFSEFLPDTYKRLRKIQSALGTKDASRVLQEQYSKIKPISIDYGIVEKTKKILTIPAEFGWSDVGQWQAVKEILTPEQAKNYIRCRHVGLDTDGSLIYAPAKKLVATIGLRDMVVIDTEDILLICPKNRSQDVKKIVQKLEAEGAKKYL
ncbi:MAG: mannose-1-phosphate guanylyltransferase [bacterium]|nr:mannose-1-phosphate guanylyltransferase [bacterium]